MKSQDVPISTFPTWFCKLNVDVCCFVALCETTDAVIFLQGGLLPQWQTLGLFNTNYSMYWITNIVSQCYMNTLEISTVWKLRVIYGVMNQKLKCPSEMTSTQVSWFKPAGGFFSFLFFFYSVFVGIGLNLGIDNLVFCRIFNQFHFKWTSGTLVIMTGSDKSKHSLNLCQRYHCSISK